MLTPAQRSKFFPLMHAAWEEYRGENALPDNVEQMDAWYRDEMASACQEAGLPVARSIKDLDHIAGYDAVMLRFAMIAQDDRAMAYFATAVERRCRKIISDLLEALTDLEQKPHTWAYARGICKHMNLPLRLEECPADMLYKVIRALDTHRRRILASRREYMPRNPGFGNTRRKREQEGFREAS